MIFAKRHLLNEKDYDQSTAQVGVQEYCGRALFKGSCFIFTFSRPNSTLCRSRKYPYSCHRSDWNFLGGGGFCKTKILKEICEALLEFPGE